MKTVDMQCLNCNANFQPLLKEINRGNGKFCSLKCSRQYIVSNTPKQKPNVECAFCKKQFYMGAYKRSKSKSGLFFCCRKHKDAAQRIGGIKAIQPPHYGRANGKYDYRKIALNHYPNKCNRCNYDRFIQALVIHHKDHNRENNDLSNFEVLCPTCHWEHHLGLV